MTVLVTGGAGFIGSHFIDLLLARGAERIVCVDDFNDGYDPALKRANAVAWAGNDRVFVIEHSFCDTAAMSKAVLDHGVRQIVHLGALAGVRASFDHPTRYTETNVHGTLAMLEAALAGSVERFVLVSSSTVYGRGAAVPFQEDAPLGVPLSPYGISKLAAEQLAQTYWQTHGLGVLSLRPFSVYGSRMRPDLAMSAFAEAILHSKPLPLFGDGTIQRDFTHVSDICAGLLAALSAENVVGQAINLGHHQPVEIRELIGLLEREIGRPAVIDHRPAFAGDMPVTCADLTKARRLLGYEPKMDLRDGVREFVAWFRKTRAPDPGG
jgi:UDP-glucuronate 4-epimerase